MSTACQSHAAVLLVSQAASLTDCKQGPGDLTRQRQHGSSNHSTCQPETKGVDACLAPATPDGTGIMWLGKMSEELQSRSVCLPPAPDDCNLLHLGRPTAAATTCAMLCTCCQKVHVPTLDLIRLRIRRLLRFHAVCSGRGQAPRPIPHTLPAAALRLLRVLRAPLPACMLPWDLLGRSLSISSCPARGVATCLRRLAQVSRLSLLSRSQLLLLPVSPAVLSADASRLCRHGRRLTPVWLGPGGACSRPGAGQPGSLSLELRHQHPEAATFGGLQRCCRQCAR